MQTFKLKTENNMLKVVYLLRKARFGSGLKTPIYRGFKPNPNHVQKTSLKMKKQVSQIELKQTELRKLLIQYAKTKTPNPKIKQLQSEIDYFYYGLKN